MRATDAFVFGADPCHVSPWWDDPPPGLTTTGTMSSSSPSGAAARAGASQSSGAWNCERARRDEPLFDDEKAVPVEVGDLLVREPIGHDRGRSFSGS